MLEKIKKLLEYKEQAKKVGKISIFGLGCFQLFQICESIYSFFK